MSMRRFGVLALLGAGIELVAAQASTTLAASPTFAPTQTWNPAATCSLGSTYPGPAPYGGVFEDTLGVFYEMQCGYVFSGTTYYETVGGTPVGSLGTTGQGIASCFYGCSNRPECIGILFTYTSQSATAGAGKCYNYLNGTQGTLSPATGQIGGQNVYGSAFIIQGSPGLLCPMYDGQTYTDNQGITYLVQCGYQPNTAIGGGSTPKSTTTVQNIQSCLSACDAAGTAMCDHAAYMYSAPNAAEPSPFSAPHAFGTCTMFTGTATPTGGGSARYMMVSRTTVLSSSSSSSSSSSFPITTTTVSNSSYISTE